MATIQITANPGAFESVPSAEAARILREIADRFEKGERRFTVDDQDGNRAAKIKADDIPGGRSRGRR